jgi:hypothetical protein
LIFHDLRHTAQGKKLGRPRVAKKVEKAVLLELGKGHGIHTVARRRGGDRDCSAHYEASGRPIGEAATASPSVLGVAVQV